MISVIIPTYKRNDNLKRAIDSVLKQKGEYELIIVDDNDPNTIYRKNNDILMSNYKKNKNVYYYKHESNKNGAAARNTGIMHAHGDYITFLDDDDEFLPNRIKKVEEILKKDDYDFIVTGFSIKKNNQLIGEYYPTIKNKKDLILGLLNQKSFFGTGSNLICKTSIVKKISGFDETFLRHQDMEFAIRFLEKSNKIYSIKENLVCKHTDDRSNMQTFEKMVSIKEKYLSKFDYILNDLTNKEKKKILVNNYYELLNTAYSKKDVNEIKKCRIYLKEKKIYNPIKEILICIKNYIKRNKFLFRLVRVIKK